MLLRKEREKIHFKEIPNCEPVLHSGTQFITQDNFCGGATNFFHTVPDGIRLVVVPLKTKEVDGYRQVKIEKIYQLELTGSRPEGDVYYWRLTNTCEILGSTFFPGVYIWVDRSYLFKRYRK